ncbi:MAG: carbohydrate binding domain-containing protein [Polyangiaceae bacterium]|nr:carbohydrate binding domain-containing protein [Polyangiaceae bacterium]
MSYGRAVRALVFLASLVLEAGACSDSESPKLANCEAGTLGCPCDARTRCVIGLSCVSGSCVELGPASGGATGTGGGSVTATGGQTDDEDTGGVSGGATGGTTQASGGSSTGGSATGGADATGGDEASGGHEASGGSGEAGSGAGGTGGGPESAGAPGSGGMDDPGTGGSSTAGNLVTNGDFSQGSTGWQLEGSGTLAITDGAACVALESADEVFLGWPPDASSAAKLDGGTRYSLSYRAKSSDSKIGVTTKVGHAADPWTTLMEETDTVGSSWGPFSHSFTPESSDDAAGVVFRMSGASGEVCFDDVVLKPAQQ